ncbi:Phenylalanyl-tRNA synthetase alpha chain [Desulfovibrio sp. X2]|uniref:phenylalanine--tRNA ligase subunit alpha n=1 Tax=Desulfovibrio sp. X2 TaxID=941449 RepID=UPI0003588C63|nr:phenylalanine--tRNA ligase subunit alpha [Desulfovibrio sp. X2]EPR41261.1 Phenylalanyl-tRNA synthetase alpha chain [Desulfovibrio sp. X2]
MSSDKSAVTGILDELNRLVGECESALGQASSLDAVEAARVEFLGRKGRLAQAMSAMASLPGEDKPAVGKAANEAKARLNELLDEAQQARKRAAAAAAYADFDPTVPGRAPLPGSLHPVTLAMEEVATIFQRLGFEVVAGPEVENDWNNFEALNMPPDHPARDMQDTLYVTDSILLRTHTSPLQVRTMLAKKPPVAIIAPGKVYRRDSDLTHTPMFHQIEGLLVDTRTSMGDLRGVLAHMCRKLFGEDTRTRFRPSFFPFTEPSSEVDITCSICKGEGSCKGSPCRVCKGTGWIEILGCGMVDPNVFASVGYDPEKYVGWAFGMGVERIAMLKYGIGDLRMFFENDLRFLGQFC